MFLFLTYFTISIISSSFIQSIRTDSNVFFFYSWALFHCAYVLQLPYPFICWWTSRLLQCLSYYKQCCSEHWGACVFQFQFPQCLCTAVGLLGHIAALLPTFKESSPLEKPFFSIVAVPVCITTNGVRRFPFLHTLSSNNCL